MSEQEKTPEKETAYQALDRIGQKWPASAEGNEALIEALIFEAWPHIDNLSKSAFGTYSKEVRKSAAGDAALALRKYNPAMKKLGGFVIDNIRHALIDEYAIENNCKDEIHPVSLDAPISSNDVTEKAFGEIVESPQPSPAELSETLSMYLDVISSMTAVVLNFKEMECRGGKKAKYAAQNRVCFTEQITCRMRDNASTRYLKQKDILYAFYLEYLSYFAEKPVKCLHSLEELQNIPLQEGHLWDTRLAPGKELSFDQSGWLSNKVPQGFLNSQGIQTSGSQVTEMRNRYMDEVRGVLMEKFQYAKSDFAHNR